MYISPTERIKKIHIWIGTTAKNEEEYNLYFDQEESPSQFAIDIGLNGDYDEDFIGIIPIFPEEKSVGAVLKEETPLHPSDFILAETKCEKLGIKSANAVFYLTDSSVVVDGSSSRHNDLFYLGIFNNSF